MRIILPNIGINNCICDMTLVPGDVTFIENKEKYFIDIAKCVASSSTHPMVPGGCVIVRDREIIGSGRSLLASCKVEVDCVAYAIATSAKHGNGLSGAIVYSTRYPFSAAVFQLHLMGIRKIVVLAHEWEPYYKDEFRRSARLARELAISIEPFFDDDDQRFTTNDQAPRFDEKEKQFQDKDLYTSNPVEDDAYPIEEITKPANDPNSFI